MNPDYLTAAYAASAPHPATFIVYINGLEVPAKAVSLRYGVWQVPEMQIEMVADPVLIRLGCEDRVQVAVFYLDDCAVDKTIKPEFRLFGEGEITGWGYRNTSGGRSIVFTVINQVAIFTQLFVHFMTTLDDMTGTLTGPDGTTTTLNASSQLVYPYTLFNQGLIAAQGTQGTKIKRPFDFLYNVVRGMMDSAIPAPSRTVPGANFFTRWARLTNFHNRFVGCPIFDEVAVDNIFPVLNATQTVAAANVVASDLMGQIQNAGSFWDMFQIVYQTMLMEVAMIPSMPLITVSLDTNLVQLTNFSEHVLETKGSTTGGKIAAALGALTTDATFEAIAGRWTSAIPPTSREKSPKRIQNYFPKPQILFGTPPSCNVIFPSQLLNVAYEENYATQPTRLYFNDEVLPVVTGMPQNGTTQTAKNALMVAWPPEADIIQRGHNTNHPKFNGKNFLLYPEEFYKGPVMDRRKVPSWLFFLKQHEIGTKPTDSAAANTPVPGAKPPTPPGVDPWAGSRVMETQSATGVISSNGQRVYQPGTEALRYLVEKAVQGTSIDVEYVMTWINMESLGKRYSTDGGRYDPKSPTQAKGYFQLSPEEWRGIGVEDPTTLVDNPSPDKADVASVDAGVKFIISSRKEADEFAKELGISWSSADMWRLTKFIRHNLPAYARSSLRRVKNTLKKPPKDWEEFYFVAKSLNPLPVELKALNNATAVGAVLPGASGVTSSPDAPIAYKAPAATPPPTGNSPTAPVSKPLAQPQAAPIDTAALANYKATNQDVYQLYAKFEYFRERYAKRSGSANIAWNPYIVPGFPGVIFDQRASRVDLMIYITSVQQRMSHDGQRNTSLGFMYGRQLQEMFSLMADEFSQNNATARSTAPEEPIRSISGIIQSFTKSEEYYQKLFYGAQPLFGKDASFDYRKIIGFEPLSGKIPDPIVLYGPDAAQNDEYAKAASDIVYLNNTRNELTATIAKTEALIEEQKKGLELLKGADVPSSANSIIPTMTQALRNDVINKLSVYTVQLSALQAQLVAIDLKLKDSVSASEAAKNTTGANQVHHNLDLAASRALVPLPDAQKYFDSYDEAIKYNWRPICTLEEYVIFCGSDADGVIPAFGHSRSVGVRYFDRIRTITAPAPDFKPPPNIDGIQSSNVAGLNYHTFPQTRADWDKALDTYRRNVLINKVPRT